MSYSPTEFLKVAHHTAEHFGFQTIDQLRKNPACKDCTVTIPHTINNTNKKIDSHGGLLSSGVVTFCEEKLHALGEPVLLYSIDQMPRTGEPAITFHIFNVERSIGEAILIQATRALATDLGHTEHTVRINSLGDKESLTRYTRELTNFLKKRLDHMPTQARELMKDHPMSALSHLVAEEHDLAYRCPNPLEFLSDPSRKHFREIIEYLDMSETPYEIDPKMLGHHEYYSDAIFSVDIQNEDGDPSPLSIRGGRFNEFVYRNTRTRTPAVGAVAVLKNNKTPNRIPRGKIGTPSVFVVQLGFGPKIRSLMLIDTLRQAGIPVMHNLASDSLSTQLREAEAKGVRYALIIGQKEFIENTVILRDMSIRNQEFVDQSALVKRLKKQTQVSA
ncbi:MAG TPA: His/Gly/Thr/Pro-type tRNA ligase C-terminal domain-containing protein [Candidatus Paceibacterota bacterium]